MQAVANDFDFSLELTVVIQLLKVAATATPKIRARRFDPHRRGSNNLNDGGKRNLALYTVNDHPNEIYRISFDGSITDEKAFAVIGGRSENVQTYLKERSSTQLPALKVALSLCHAALEQVANQKLPSENLEVAVLDRTRKGRKFRRLSVGDTRQLIAS